MSQERHRNLWFARFARGCNVMMSLFASVLALTLFTHVATCDPCYDDDVCAAARIDNVAKFTVAKIVEIGKAKGDTTVFLQPQRSVSAVAVLPTALEWHAIGAGFSGIQEPLHRNSTLAHRRTVVLLV
jgi:hypothetical protein